MLLSILIVFCAAAIIVAGLLAWLRNTERRENKWFFLFTVFLGLWTVSNFIDSNSIVSVELTRLFVIADFALAPFIGYCFLQFAALIIHWPNHRSETLINYIGGTNFRIISLATTLATSALALLGYVFSTEVAHNELLIHLKWPLVIYAIPLLSALGTGLAILAFDYIRSSRADRRRLSLVLVGFLVAVVGNVATNLVFPVFIDDRSIITSLNLIGYVGIFFFVFCIYLAITTRKLFDMRLAIVRSIAYLALFASVVVLYVSLVIVSSYTFFNDQTIQAQTLAISLAAALFVAITFPYLQKFFDKVTRRIFFRDAYKTQDVLDQVSDITTSTIKIDQLLDQSALLLAHVLKAGYCTFVLAEEHKLNRIIGIGDSKLQYERLEGLLFPLLKSQMVVITEMLPNSKLANLLRRSSTEIVVPLYTNKVVVGYIAMGPKKNGMAYMQQDVRMLSLASATLAVAIQNALRFEEIERFNETLKREVENATRKLRQTNEKLRQLDETKDDFISMASHQLRTPLTSVKGYVSMVVEGDAGPLTPLQRKLLNQAFISSQRMVYLISDLLNVSRLRTGKFIIEPVQSNLSTVVQEEVRQLVSTAKGRGLELVYHKPEHFPVLMFDETKMRQVVMNFIDNAIYYTQSGGKITVALVDNPQSVEFTVTDTGIGVPKADQYHLFSKFYRANNAKRARPDGTGLGLFMAKKVIVAQGGATIFRSQEGKGSTFGFTFAKAPLVPTRPPESHVLKH